MIVNEIRIYAEVLEQGIDFKKYISKLGFTGPIKNIYAKKSRGGFKETDTLIDRIRKVKDIDVLITAVCSDSEYPILLIEYSTAVPVDDHKMQRSDVYYWSAVFKAPVMKISPVSKGMNQQFGGGSKFTDELEIAMACKRNAVFYPIHWENEENKDVLAVNQNALSCIYYSSEIENILSNLINCLSRVDTFSEYYECLQKEYIALYKDTLTEYTIDKIKSIISNSSRFHWFGDRLSVKINRFGHAMDPDRGILYFINMLIGAENTITEIQVNRSSPYKRKRGYSSLFNSLGREALLKEYVEKIIEKGNIFTDDDALYIFKTALNIDDALYFEQTAPHTYIINDDNLETFLLNHPSISTKSIFYLSTELRLTDINRNIICIVRWNKKPIDKFLSSISSARYDVTEVSPLSIGKAKEDIITYASVKLYKKIQCGLLAVSYPGAQGDRCVLTGSGKNVLRTYIDIIAYKDSENGIKVYLEECKYRFSQSAADVVKINKFKTDDTKYDELKVLFRKIIATDDISEIYTSVAAKAARNIPHFDVDYIFMFDIEDDGENTNILYSVAVIDTNLINDFKALENPEGKLKGKIKMDKIYIIS